MALVIIPVAVSVHTVVSWIFGMTLRAGWHSTIFGPYFVVGAIFSGIAALLTAMALFVKFFPYLDRYITVDHFRKLASLLLAVNLIYI
jgi:molybdopterin-containing oxidoreductase family membrane subunit